MRHPDMSPEQHVPAAEDSLIAEGPPIDSNAPVDNEVPIDVLEARICGLATRMAQATYHWLAMIAQFDERGGWVGVGIKSCAHWLSWTCSVAPGTAREHVRVARALTALPLVSQEMAAGRLSYAKVRELTRVSDRIDESRLVELARTATASQFARAARGFRRSDGERGRQEQARRASWFTDTDGSVVLSARLPAEEGAMVIAALEAARDDLRRASAGDRDTGHGDRDTGAGDRDTGHGDRDTGAGGVPLASSAAEGLTCAPDDNPAPEPVDAADALLQWARGYLAVAPEDRSGEDRTTVVVHVSAEHLDPVATGPAAELVADPSAPYGTDPDADPDAAPAGIHDAHRDSDAHTQKHSRGNVTADDATAPGRRAATRDYTAVPADCCQVAGVGGIERDTAARLACDATLIGMIRGTGGAVLAHGRRRRVVSSAQRRALQVRDGGCQFPSCQRVSHLEAHHVQHWSRGGRTDMDNLVLLCRFHHVACHEGGVRVTATGESCTGHPQWRFTTADGEPMRGQPSTPEHPETGWKHDAWILWHALDGDNGSAGPDANTIRPLWAGERFSLADTVSMLFGSPKEPAAAAA